MDVTSIKRKRGAEEISKTAKSRCKNVTCVSEESENKTVKNDETSISWEEVL